MEENINGEIVFNQPAGHLDNHESLVQAVIRETLEETRWDFLPAYISGIYQWTHANSETYMRICFVGEITKEHKNLSLDTGIERTVWLTVNEIKNINTRSPLVLKCIEDYTSGQKFPLSLIQNIR